MFVLLFHLASFFSLPIQPLSCTTTPIISLLNAFRLFIMTEAKKRKRKERKTRNHNVQKPLSELGEISNIVGMQASNVPRTPSIHPPGQDDPHASLFRLKTRSSSSSKSYVLTFVRPSRPRRSRLMPVTLLSRPIFQKTKPRTSTIFEQGGTWLRMRGFTEFIQRPRYILLQIGERARSTKRINQRRRQQDLRGQ